MDGAHSRPPGWPEPPAAAASAPPPAGCGGDEIVSAPLPRALATELAELACAGRIPRLTAGECEALCEALARAGISPTSGHSALAPLPLCAALGIASRLPADEILLLARVSRSFRALAASPSLFRVVCLAVCSGVTRVSDGLLRAVCAAARGGIVELDVSGQASRDGPLSWAAVTAAAAANARSLRRLAALSTSGRVTPLLLLEGLLRAAPRLEALAADASCCAGAAARAVLRRESPFGPLRVRWLKVTGPWNGEEAVVALAGDIAARLQPSLTELILWDAPLQTPAALAALVDAVAGLGGGGSLVELRLCRCSVTPESAPELARLLLPPRDGDGCGGGGLRTLAVDNVIPLLDEAHAPALCSALSGCGLLALELTRCALWRAPAVSMALVAALVKHATIASVSLAGNPAPGDAQAAIGTALAVLVAADGLTELCVSACALGDAGLRPVLAALRGCTRLRALKIGDNGATQAFVRDELLPAVTANASLRTLVANGVPSVPALAQAEALVAARPPVVL